MALLLRLRDDALLQCICRVPFVAHDAVRCVCRRLRDLAARDRLRRARRAAGWEENALVVAGGFGFFQHAPEEFEDCDYEDYRDVFALLSGRWRRMASLPVGRCQCGVVVKDDAIWCIGGSITLREEGEEEAIHIDGAHEVAIFKPSENSWTIVEAPELLPRCFGATVLSPGGDVIRIGGFHPQSQANEVNIIEDQHAIREVEVSSGDDGASWRLHPEIPDPVGAGARLYFGHRAIGVFKSELFLTGGLVRRPGSGYQTEFRIFDFVTKEWTMGPSLPLSICEPAGLMHRGLFYVIGGMHGPATADGYVDTASNAVYVFDTTADRETASWSRACDLPTPRCYHSAVVHEDRIVIVGGRSKAYMCEDSVCANLYLSDDGLEWLEAPALPRPDLDQPASRLDEQVRAYSVGIPSSPMAASVPIG